MAYKLSIGNIIDYPVHLKVRDGAAVKDFKFHVQALRIDAQQAKDLMTSGTVLGDQSIDEFLRGHITGWSGQRLVVDEADQPAPYSVEALTQVQTLPGASMTLYRAYLTAVVASDGAEGVRKN